MISTIRREYDFFRFSCFYTNLLKTAKFALLRNDDGFLIASYATSIVLKNSFMLCFRSSGGGIRFVKGNIS